MIQEMLVESDPHQNRIAVLEDGRLTEILVERRRSRALVGNIYKGRVTRVLPGMQAAFVDIGLERDAYLYVTDADGDTEGLDGLGLDASEAESVSEPEPSIADLLTQGQEIIVQLIKDPLPNKGARISTHVTLPGRYLVLLPTVRHLGVSRRIEEEAERARLLEVLEGLVPEHHGLIVRTVGEGRSGEEFERDLVYLHRLWERIRQRAERVPPLTLLHQDLDLPLRAVRDLFNAEFKALHVEGEDIHQRILDFLEEVEPTLRDKVRLYRDSRPLFQRYGVEAEIESALKSKVWLKSGGHIVINPTEALVAIDVNTGRYVGRHSLEETVLRTNLEAVEEVVRQIRLRDLGGIIVLDLIDMIEEENREQVFRALEEELKKDRAKNKVLNISEFGLVEITRKRSRANLELMLTQPCPYCQGRGRIKSIATICLNLRREVLARGDRLRDGELLLRVHPEIAAALQGEEREILEELESSLGTSILLQSARELHHERFDLSEV